MIYNAPSIYKQGGGGGGYKDGGELVDGDFIKVANNTISTYDNESRDPVNFYFDVKDGELINSVIEFTTEVNADINIYYVDSNGILIPLSYVSSNQVTAGESYTITIIGKSFILENIIEITPDPNEIIVINEIDNNIYKCVKLNGVFWATSNFKDYCQWAETQTIRAPWRVPTSTDFYNLTQNYTVESVTMPGTWNSKVSPAPTNTTGLSFKGIGYKETIDGPIKRNEMLAWFWQDKNLGGVNSMAIRVFQNMYNPNDCYWDLYESTAYNNIEYYSQLRLIYDP